MTLPDAWTRLRAWPLVWQLALGTVALVAVLWVTGGLESAVSHWRDSRADAKVEKMQEQIDALTRNAERDAGRVQAVETELQNVRAEQAETNNTLRQLAEDAAEKDRRVEASGARYRATRSSRAPTRADDWERRARDLYPPD